MLFLVRTVGKSVSKPLLQLEQFSFSLLHMDNHCIQKSRLPLHYPFGHPACHSITSSCLQLHGFGIRVPGSLELFGLKASVVSNSFLLSLQYLLLEIDLRTSWIVLSIEKLFVIFLWLCSGSSPCVAIGQNDELF